MIVANAVTPVVYSISRGNLHDAPQGRELLETPDGRHFRKSQNGKNNRSYTGFRAGGSAQNEPSKIVAIRQKNCKRRNEVERFFRRLKGFRR
ncbi:MAG: IS5/IS1182 family transposase, partial [Planctomycetia bacterium]|nr:IS5/IS1182 family transposase [Planctomycetia bacterium]